MGKTIVPTSYSYYPKREHREALSTASHRRVYQSWQTKRVWLIQGSKGHTVCKDGLNHAPSPNPTPPNPCRQDLWDIHGNISQQKVVSIYNSLNLDWSSGLPWPTEYDRVTNVWLLSPSLKTSCCSHSNGIRYLHVRKSGPAAGRCDYVGLRWAVPARSP